MAVARVLVGKVSGGAFPRGGVVWRLVAANNTTLARAPRACADVASCVAEVKVLSAGFDRCEVRVLEDRPGWRWTLELDGVTVAVSARRSTSRRDAHEAAAGFLERFPAALAASVPSLQRALH